MFDNTWLTYFLLMLITVNTLGAIFVATFIYHLNAERLELKSLKKALANPVQVRSRTKLSDLVDHINRTPHF